MPETDRKKLSAMIKSQELPPVCFLWGEEDFETVSYTHKIEKAVCGGDSLSLVLFEGAQAVPAEIAAACNTMILGQKRCVSVNDMKLSSTTNNRKLSDEDIEPLLEYLSDPNPLTVLLFRFTEKKEFTNSLFKKLRAAAAKTGISVEFRRYTAVETEKMLCLIASKNGCTMHTATARYLAAAVGGDLNTLKNELDKLCAAAYGREIQTRDIDALCAKNLEAHVFDIYNAVIRGDADKVFSIVDTLMLMHEEPVRVLAAVGSSYTAMYYMKAASLSKLSPGEMSGMIKNTKSKNQLDFAGKECRRFSKECLARCVEILAAADLDMKTAPVDQRILLERALTQLIEQCGTEKRGAV